jgi:hypothetical protein
VVIEFLSATILTCYLFDIIGIYRPSRVCIAEVVHSPIEAAVQTHQIERRIWFQTILTPLTTFIS